VQDPDNPHQVWATVTNEGRQACYLQRIFYEVLPNDRSLRDTTARTGVIWTAESEDEGSYLLEPSKSVTLDRRMFTVRYNQPSFMRVHAETANRLVSVRVDLPWPQYRETDRYRPRDGKPDDDNPLRWLMGGEQS